MSTDLLFVYGTLRRAAAHSMHRLLHPATFLGRGEFQGRLYHLGNYPGMIRSDDPADVVHGEVYRLHEPAATLARLDEYEGCAGVPSAATEYARVEGVVRLAGGGEGRVHLYLYQKPLEGVRQIVSGDFLADADRLSSG